MTNPRVLIPLMILILALDLGSGTRLGGRRRRGGALLSPPRRPEGTELPEDQWFLQKLDHFHPTDGRTWKQVGVKGLKDSGVDGVTVGEVLGWLFFRFISSGCGSERVEVR